MKAFNLLILGIVLSSFIYCQSNRIEKVVSVNPELFITDSDYVTVKEVDCELSDGSKTKCYEITTRGIPTEHKVGPFCPEHITDDSSNGGKWYLDSTFVDIDGDFIKNMAKNYHDDFWKMYDKEGKVIKTETKEECELISLGQLSDELINHCIDCQLSYISEDYTRTFLIPKTPIKLKSPYKIPEFKPQEPPQSRDRPPGPPPMEKNIERPPGPPPGGGAQVRGIAFNGVVFDAPAPIKIIMSGYTIAPLDDAGGHVNPNTGYHYHEATGKTKEINQNDNHESMIGYAMDGYGLYSHGHYNDLDIYNGHYDEIRGYHYHVPEEGSNSFLEYFRGAIAKIR